MPHSPLEVILFCPTGQDAKLISAVLEKEFLDTMTVMSVNELCARTQKNAGVLVIADEALTTEGLETLNRALLTQETWSDIPIILLTSGGIRGHQFKFKRLEVFVTSGNVTLLERPFQPQTLLSASQVALRARKRQYQVRDLLVSQTEATHLRDEFISIASHELKTPLTSLKLQTQMSKRQFVKTGSITSERIYKQLDTTINQIDRLNKLVDDMLDISRINTGKLNIQKNEFNFSDLLENLVDRFMPQFEAVECVVVTDIQPEVFGLWDSFKLEQVVNNLFSNAIRYSPRKPIKIILRTQGHKAILTVEDQGIGIDPMNRERIFERFERASTVVSGLGLGLYITKQILDLHEGTIRVESELEKGSTFIIELPL